MAKQKEEQGDGIHPLGILTIVLILLLGVLIMFRPVKRPATPDGETLPNGGVTVAGLSGEKAKAVSIPNPLVEVEGDIRAVEVMISWGEDGLGHIVFTAYGFREVYLSIAFFSKFNGELDYVVTTGDYYFRTKHKPNDEWRKVFERVRNFPYIEKWPPDIK